MGLMMASNALSRIMAPPLFGLIYSMNMDAPYYFGALMILCVLPVAWQVVGMREREGVAAHG
jgi:hypothetical protein